MYYRYSIEIGACIHRKEILLNFKRPCNAKYLYLSTCHFSPLIAFNYCCLASFGSVATRMYALYNTKRSLRLLCDLLRNDAGTVYTLFCKPCQHRHQVAFLPRLVGLTPRLDNLRFFFQKGLKRPPRQLCTAFGNGGPPDPMERS